MQRSVVEVSSGVFVATSERYATTSTVVLRDGAALLVDPAWTPAELDGLVALIAALGVEVGAGVATHAHHDHLLWHPSFGAAPRWASARTVQRAARHHDELLAALGPDWPASLAAVFGQVRAAGDHVPFAEDVELVAHDGHAPGHAAVWLPARRVLLAGDMLSDLELPLPLDPDDLPAYLAGLDVLAPYVARAQVLVPGHGTPTSEPMRRLDADRRYLDAVLAGDEPDDSRLAHDDMVEVHRRVMALARDQRR